MRLAERDLQLLYIEKEIKHRKELLRQKKRELENKSKINEFLGTLKSDYNKYYDKMVQEKHQQYNALLILNEYLSDLKKTDKLVEHQIKVANHDQKDIMKEIAKVKRELDELLQ
jgi:hypothetical protein